VNFTVLGASTTCILTATRFDPPTSVQDTGTTPPDLPWAAILIVLGIVVAVGTTWYLRRTYRNWAGESQVHAWASYHGMRYMDRNEVLASNWSEAPFGYGARTSYNVVEGLYQGRRTTLFDLGDRSTSGATSRLILGDRVDLQERMHGHVASVVVMSLPYFIESELTLQPLKGINRLRGSDRGRRHLDLESDDFNRRYDVICGDRDLAYAFFTPRTIELLLGQPPVEIRVRGMQVLLLGEGPLRPDRMNRWVATLSAIIENVSPHVWSDRGKEAVAELDASRRSRLDG
jgi:hypothetical protein